MPLSEKLRTVTLADGVENRLQADVLTLGRKQIHLEKALIGLLLYFEQVGNRENGLYLSEIDTFPVNVLDEVGHA